MSEEKSSESWGAHTALRADDSKADPLPFRVGPWWVDPSLNLLRGEGCQQRRLGNKAMALLLYLAARQGRLATKDELVRDVWGGRAVSDDALAVCVYELRKSLGDSARSPSYIETIQGKGYRWLPSVEWQPEGASYDPISGAASLDQLSTETLSKSRQDPARTPISAPDLSDKPPDTNSSAGSDPARIDLDRADLDSLGVVRKSALFGSSYKALSIILGMALLTAAAVAVAFWHPEAQSVPDFKTVAVLPLDDFSPSSSPGDRVFADGMTEALIHALARHGPLRVISRTSVSRFASPTGLTAPEIAEKLGADLLVEGSLVRVGDAVRISVQLIDGASDNPLWTDSYDADLGDLLSLQWHVADEVAREIRLHAGDKTLPTSKPPLLRTQSMATESVDAYLLGRAELYDGFSGDGGKAAVVRAIEAFTQAVELEPDFAEAHVGIAQSQIALYWRFQAADSAKAAAKARKALARALDIDPRLAMAHSLQGSFHMAFGHDLESAEQSFRLALSLEPSCIDCNLGYSWLLQDQRRFGKAEDLLQQARHLDPLSPLPLQAMAMLKYNSGQPEEALEYVDRLDKVLPVANRILRATALHNLGRYDEASRAYLGFYESIGVGTEELADLEDAYQKAGIQGLMRQTLKGSIGRRSRAILRMRLGEPEAALDLLSQATADDDPALLMVYASPIFVPLHDDPRFVEILRHYGLSP